MSDSMRFPKNPLEGMEQRFADAEGKNPYADENAATTGTDDNVFAPPNPTAGEQPDYQPVYQDILPHRARRMQTLAIVGFVLSVSLGVISIWTMYALILSICNLALTISTWMMSRGEYRAIVAGAMSQDGRRKTLVAMWLAIAGSMVSFGVVAVHVAINWILPLTNQ